MANTEDIDRDRNVLWLNNHVTAGQFECDLLTELGYNVFVPKYYPAGYRSFAPNFDYDSSLPLTARELDILNSHDFYSQCWPPAVRFTLNRYFGTAIVGCFPQAIYETIAGFKGRILIRSYGPFDETATVWEFLQGALIPGFRRILAEVGDRFWFSEAYPNLADPEHEFLKSRRVNLPTGISTAVQAKRHTYKREVDKVLIVLPDILGGDRQSADGYTNVRRYFGKLPKVIAGRQSVPIDDPEVAGLIPWSEYEALLSGSAAMFYHNVNPRHIHYHPVEAACFGMPVIFMRRGMLGVLGNPDAPGACRTYAEARVKLSRILAGDKAFISDVVDAQKPWVDYFMSESNRHAWTERFSSRIVQGLTLTLPTKRHRVALMFLVHPGAFFPEYADLMARAFQEVDDKLEKPEIVVALLRDDFCEADVAAVEAWGWKCRLFEWRQHSLPQVLAALEFTGRSVPLWSSTYLTPVDVQGSLQDCDGWVVMLDGASLDHPIAPTKPIIPVVRGDSRMLAGNVVSEIISNAHAVAVSGILQRDSLVHLRLNQFNSFSAPMPKSAMHMRTMSRSGPILIVLPKSATLGGIDDLRNTLSTEVNDGSHFRHFIMVSMEEPAESSPVGAPVNSGLEPIESLIKDIADESRHRHSFGGARHPRIELARGINKTREAFEVCSGIWFPLGAVFDLGLLTWAAERNLPLVSLPSKRMQMTATTIGLDYRPVESLDLLTVEEAFSAPVSADPSVQICPTDVVDTSLFIYDWCDVVSSL